jgi:hypothetical protein
MRGRPRRGFSKSHSRRSLIRRRTLSLAAAQIAHGPADDRTDEQAGEGHGDDGAGHDGTVLKTRIAERTAALERGRRRDSAIPLPPNLEGFPSVDRK